MLPNQKRRRLVATCVETLPEMKCLVLFLEGLVDVDHRRNGISVQLFYCHQHQQSRPRLHRPGCRLTSAHFPNPFYLDFRTRFPLTVIISPTTVRPSNCEQSWTKRCVLFQLKPKREPIDAWNNCLLK